MQLTHDVGGTGQEAEPAPTSDWEALEIGLYGLSLCAGQSPLPRATTNKQGCTGTPGDVGAGCLLVSAPCPKASRWAGEQDRGGTRGLHPKVTVQQEMGVQVSI